MAEPATSGPSGVFALESIGSAYTFRAVRGLLTPAEQAAVDAALHAMSLQNQASQGPNTSFQRTTLRMASKFRR